MYSKAYGFLSQQSNFDSIYLALSAVIGCNQIEILTSYKEKLPITKCEMN